MYQYSVDKVELTWQGLDLKDGLAKGSSITESRTNPARWTMTADSRGKVTRSKQTDGSGTVTLLATQAGALHQSLRLLVEQDAGDKPAVGPMVLKDLTTGEQFTYKAAFVMTDPDEIRGDEAQDFSWVMGFESVTRVPGLAGVNNVG
jgi:hypothetical protein